MIDWYLLPFKRCFNPGGRSTRKEYWIFTLINAIIYIGITSLTGEDYNILSTGFLIIIFIPHLSVYIRRLHDIGKSGLWILAAIIPIIGFFILLYYTCLDSQPGTNKYGPNPKGVQ